MTRTFLRRLFERPQTEEERERLLITLLASNIIM